MIYKIYKIKIIYFILFLLIMLILSNIFFLSLRIQRKHYFKG